MIHHPPIVPPSLDNSIPAPWSSSHSSTKSKSTNNDGSQKAHHHHHHDDDQSTQNKKKTQKSILKQPATPKSLFSRLASSISSGRSSSSSSSRQQFSHRTENDLESNSYIEENEESATGSVIERTTHHHQNNSSSSSSSSKQEHLTFVSSFAISSSRLRQFLNLNLKNKKKSRIQISIGLILLISIIGTLISSIILGLRHANIQQSKRSDRINNKPVRIPLENEFKILSSSSSSSSSSLSSIKNQPPQTREFFFIIDERIGKLDGYEKDMLVVNGQYPGPTIEVNQEDLVMIHVQNNSLNRTSITWHGLLQLGTSYSDGMKGISECGIPSGENMTYSFKLGNFSGTTFWHSGYDAQTSDGISGPFIVHPTTPSNDPVNNDNHDDDYDEEVILHLSDLYHQTSTDLLHQYLSPSGIHGDIYNEPVPDSGTINGIGQYYHLPDAHPPLPSYYRMTVEFGKKYRLRLMNAGSFAPIQFSIDSHELTVIEINGIQVLPLNLSYKGITLYPGERYSLILNAHHQSQSKPKSFWMRATLKTQHFRYSSPDSNFKVLGILKYGEDVTELPEEETETEEKEKEKQQEEEEEVLLDLNYLDQQLRPLNFIKPPIPTQTYLLDVGFSKAEDGSLLGVINSHSNKRYNHQNHHDENSELLQENINTTTTTTTSSLLKKLGMGVEYFGETMISSEYLISHDQPEVIELIIENYSSGTYPFTLHGYRPWLIERGQGKYNGIIKSNTTHIPPMKPPKFLGQQQTSSSIQSPLSTSSNLIQQHFANQSSPSPSINTSSSSSSTPSIPKTSNQNTLTLPNLSPSPSSSSSSYHHHNHNDQLLQPTLTGTFGNESLYLQGHQQQQQQHEKKLDKRQQEQSQQSPEPLQLSFFFFFIFHFSFHY